MSRLRARNAKPVTQSECDFPVSQKSACSGEKGLLSYKANNILRDSDGRLAWLIATGYIRILAANISPMPDDAAIRERRRDSNSI